MQKNMHVREKEKEDEKHHISGSTDMHACVLSHLSRVRLCDPMDCCLPGSSVHGDSPGKDIGVGCHSLLRGCSQPRDGTSASCTR